MSSTSSTSTISISSSPQRSELRQSVRSTSSETAGAVGVICAAVRQFIRHPSNIPIEVTQGEQHEHDLVHNVSLGGLAFETDHALPIGTVIGLRIDAVRPPFSTTARVVWCKSLAERFELGVEFLEASAAFRARMVEQVCHIEQHKQHVHKTEGRVLTSQQAAMEWIEAFASKFPQTD